MYRDEDLLNKSQLAEALGVSKPYVTKLTKNGTLVFNQENNRKIKFGDAKKSIEENSDPSRSEFKKNNNVANNNSKYVKKEEKKERVEKEDGESDSSEDSVSDEDVEFFLGKTIEDFRKEVSSLSFNEAKTKNEQMKLIISKIKADKELEYLVSIEDVSRNSFEIGKVLNQSLMSIPNRMCDLLSNIDDPKIIYKKLNEEIRKVLEDVIEKLKEFE